MGAFFSHERYSKLNGVAGAFYWVGWYSIQRWLVHSTPLVGRFHRDGRCFLQGRVV